MKCQDLILHDFVIMKTTGDFSRLSSDPDEGKSLFDAIADEFAALVNSPTFSNFKSTLDELVLLRSRLLAVEAATIVLESDQDAVMIDVLHTLGYDFDPEHYADSLKKIRKQQKSTRYMIETTIKRYEVMLKKTGDQRETYQDYVRTLAILSKHHKIHLNIKELTVAEFAAYYELYLTDLKRSGNG